MADGTPSIPAPPTLGSRRRRLQRSHGIRAGALVGLATLGLSVGGYLFQTACIRFLGPTQFGDVAALLALTTVVAIPLGSIQSLLAREISYLAAVGASDQLRLLLRRTMRTAIPSALGVLAISLALTVPIENALNIQSAAVVVAGLSCLAFLVVAAILYGFLQGAQRFRPLALTYVISGAFRPALVVPVLFLGFGAAGALTVNTIAALLAVVLASYFLKDLWRRAPGIEVDPPKLDHREVAVLMIGSLAFASLTNIDVVLASFFLGGDEAGIYAAAALLGKFVLLLSAGVVIVLLPKAAARAASGGTSERILLLSAAVTLVLSLAATVVLALIPEDLLIWAFGPDFSAASDLLGIFGLAMTAAALVNVYLFVYLAEKDVWFPCLVGLAAVAQVVVVSLWHSGPRDIVLTTLACSLGVLFVHEVAFPHAVVRVLRGRAIRA